MGGDEPARTLIAAALGDGQARRHREQARHRPPRAGARGDRPADRRAAALRGRGRRRDPGPRAARRRTSPPTASTRVRGIVNGTTNYILTAMTDEATRSTTPTSSPRPRRLGYAEADPTGDVEGDDAVNKLVILARLAFGAGSTRRRSPTPPPTAPTARPDPGITGGQPRPTKRDARGGRAGSSSCLATAVDRRPPDGAVAAAVLPTALPLDSAARAGRPASATGSRSTPCRSAGSGSTGRAPAAPATSRRVLGDLHRASPARRGLDLGRRDRRRVAPTGDRAASARPAGATGPADGGERHPVPDR